MSSSSSTPAKRKRASESSGSSGAKTKTENPKLQFVQAITTVKKQMEGFKKSVDQWNTVNDDIFTNLELKLEQKQRELAELDTEFTNTKRQRKIETEQELRELGYAAVAKLLADRKEIAVSEERWQDLNKQFNELRTNHEAKVAAAVAEERAIGEKNIKSLERSLKLEHTATMAQAQARMEQQAQQIKVLEQSIASLKADIEAQRQLTKDIANAANRPAPVYTMRDRDRGSHE